MKGIQGLRIIVAGGATGIGATTSKLLAKNGAKVVIGDINITTAKQVADQIKSAGGTATAIAFDFSQEESIKSLIENAVDFLGGLDGIANMGADLRPEILGRDSGVDTMDASVWRRTMDVNLIGYALSTKYSLPYLLQQVKGTIVNISSASVAIHDPPHPAYSASKAGVQILTKHTAVRWGSQNIRANCVSFGPISTPPMVEAAKNPKIKEQLEAVPLQRMGEPEEAASAVLYLLSSESCYVTGQVWQVNGGAVCRD